MFRSSYFSSSPESTADHDKNETLSSPSSFISQANCNTNILYERAFDDHEAYWAERAAELDWFDTWRTVCEWQPPYCKWFVDGKINITYNCLDRHVKAGNGDQIALHWQAETGEMNILTYQELLQQVSRCANGLKNIGVRKGDRVAIYMPMLLQSVVAMLACARIGAIHSVVFGGFSAQALADRINDAQCSVVITADGGWRRGNIVPLKHNVDQALEYTSSVKHVVVYNRLDPVLSPAYCTMNPERDIWYGDLIKDQSDQCDPVALDAEDILFILYTSGTTGKPKGIVHTVGGYAVGAYTTCKYVFDMKPSDLFWCTADVGWITGHTYVAYGPLLVGASQLLYEGAPDYPEKDCFWRIIADYKVSIFYTAPTAIRMFSKWGTEWVKNHDLSSLRLLGSVGEPLNPEAWRWYYTYIGNKNCPIVDTWWQTETGSHMISTLPGVHTMQPGSVGYPLPGIAATIVDDKGNELAHGAGHLVITKPWPSMMRTIWADDERFKKTYFRNGDYRMYYAGDGAVKTKDGRFIITGRTDDVLSVAGHRLGTMELESALIEHVSVAEAAVIGRADTIKGQAIVAFVSCKRQVVVSEKLANELKQHIVSSIGPFARPQEIIFVQDLPKTRSGKIMRRLLRDIAEKRAIGDITTLADLGVVEEITQQYLG